MREKFKIINPSKNIVSEHSASFSHLRRKKLFICGQRVDPPPPFTDMSATIRFFLHLPLSGLQKPRGNCFGRKSCWAIKDLIILNKKLQTILLIGHKVSVNTSLFLLVVGYFFGRYLCFIHLVSCFWNQNAIYIM